MVMPYNQRFTNWVTRSVLEIRSPHFYARPEQARAVQKRLGFVFPGTDRLTWLVNRYDKPEALQTVRAYDAFTCNGLFQKISTPPPPMDDFGIPVMNAR